MSYFSLVDASSEPVAWVVRLNSSFAYRLILNKANESPNTGFVNELKSEKAMLSQFKEMCVPNLDIYKRFLRSGVVARQTV